MIKYITYLISLFFIFGITINEGVVYAQKDSPTYRITETLRNYEEDVSSHRSTFVYEHFFERGSLVFVFPIANIGIEKIHDHQVKTALKTRKTQSLEIISVVRILLLQKVVISKSDYLLYIV